MPEGGNLGIGVLGRLGPPTSISPPMAPEYGFSASARATAGVEAIRHLASDVTAAEFVGCASGFVAFWVEAA
jgi:hypothetical protein